jgi:hypothetical protein
MTALTPEERAKRVVAAFCRPPHHLILPTELEVAVTQAIRSATVDLQADNERLRAELEQWVVASEDFSLPHLRELIIAVRCFGQPLAEAVERLESMREAKPSSQHSPEKSRTGFLNGAIGGPAAARH